MLFVFSRKHVGEKKIEWGTGESYFERMFYSFVGCIVTLSPQDIQGSSTLKVKC